MFFLKISCFCLVFHQYVQFCTKIVVHIFDNIQRLSIFTEFPEKIYYMLISSQTQPPTFIIELKSKNIYCGSNIHSFMIKCMVLFIGRSSKLYLLYFDSQSIDGNKYILRK